MAKTLVTGGTGFVGLHAVRELARRGDDLRLLVRERSNTELLGGIEWERAVGDVTDRDSVRKAMNGVERVFQEMVDRAKRMRPDAEIHGVTLQPMLASADGVELIVGAKKDPVFGAVMMIGAGGITAEILADRALELPPLNERFAYRMLESLRIRPLLHGFRGRRCLRCNWTSRTHRDCNATHRSSRCGHSPW